MRADSYSTAFTVDQSPKEVFDAINNVRAWWEGDITGDSGKLGDTFTYRYGTMHRTTQKVTEFVPGQKVVWHVVDAELNFVNDKTEWTGTDIVFEITRRGDKTELRFTHVGLFPEMECFVDCSSAWGTIINESLAEVIAGTAAETA